MHSGYGFAVVGVALAFLERTDEGDTSVVGYFMALVAAFGWAGSAPSASATRIGEQPAEAVLFAQFLTLGPLLFIRAPFFGPFTREIDVFDGLDFFFRSLRE